MFYVAPGALSTELQMEALVKNGFDTEDSIAGLVRNGKGIMSPYAKSIRNDGTASPARLTEAEIREVSSFVLERARSGWR